MHMLRSHTTTRTGVVLGAAILTASSDRSGSGDRAAFRDRSGPGDRAAVGDRSGPSDRSGVGDRAAVGERNQRPGAAAGAIKRQRRTRPPSATRSPGEPNDISVGLEGIGLGGVDMDGVWRGGIGRGEVGRDGSPWLDASTKGDGAVESNPAVRGILFGVAFSLLLWGSIAGIAIVLMS
jgi:hypothetical protein